MARIGAELGQMQSLGKTFDQKSKEVEQLRSSIRKQVVGTDWEGPAARRFRDAWNGEFEPALKKLQAALNEAGTEVKRRRDAIEKAGS